MSDQTRHFEQFVGNLSNDHREELLRILLQQMDFGSERTKPVVDVDGNMLFAIYAAGPTVEYGSITEVDDELLAALGYKSADELENAIQNVR